MRGRKNHIHFPIISLLLASACSTPMPHKPESASYCPGHADCFTDPENPAQGLARIYVFRPNMADDLTTDTPEFTLHDVGTMQLAWQTYTAFDVPVGTYRFSVSPRPGESKLWNVRGELNVSVPGRYFLVIWNGGRSITPDASNPAASALGVQNPMAGAIATALSYAISSPRTVDRYVRHEVISESDALDTIRLCRLSPPLLLGKAAHQGAPADPSASAAPPLGP